MSDELLHHFPGLDSDPGGRVGPALQAAMFEAGELPPLAAVEEFSARARKALDG
jgi:hypothetical protein